MFAEIDNLKVYYEIKGKGEPIFLLHGWAGRIESFKPVFEILSSKFKIYAFDLPGFGRSNLPSYTWGTSDYASFIIKFLEKEKLQKIHLIGHSFGGRIAITLAANFPEKIKKLILVDSAGIKPKKSLLYYLKIGIFKAWKKLCFGKFGKKMKNILYHLLGSNDYKEAGQMRNILVKIVNEDLKYLLPQIKTPTLLIWGEQDKAVPIKYAKIMEKEIKNSQLIIFKNAGHFSYLDKLKEFCQSTINFLEN